MYNMYNAYTMYDIICMICIIRITGMIGILGMIGMMCIYIYIYTPRRLVNRRREARSCVIVAQPLLKLCNMICYDIIYCNIV